MGLFFYVCVCVLAFVFLYIGKNNKRLIYVYILLIGSGRNKRPLVELPHKGGGNVRKKNKRGNEVRRGGKITDGGGHQMDC